MSDIEEKNAIIVSATITNESGVLTSFVHLDYGGQGQGFGGLVLFNANGLATYNYAGHFIWRVMQIARVKEWSELEGKTVRVRCKDGMVISIGDIVKDIWFCPRKDFEVMLSGRIDFGVLHHEDSANAKMEWSK